MVEIIWLAATGAAGAFGYAKSRGFVRTRLRFVDGVRKPYAPFIAGGVAAAAAAPVAWLLPFVGTASAVIFGASVGAGVASGRKELDQGGS